jgi:hypothetical protein
LKDEGRRKKRRKNERRGEEEEGGGARLEERRRGTSPSLPPFLPPSLMKLMKRNTQAIYSNNCLCQIISKLCNP